MPDLYTLATCALLAILTWGYTLLLRGPLSSYEPRWTWLTVVVGVALVGAGVAARMFLLPIPAYEGATLLAWGWWMWVWHFTAGGLPVVWWQIDHDHKALQRALEVARKRPETGKEAV